MAIGDRRYGGERRSPLRWQSEIAVTVAIGDRRYGGDRRSPLRSTAGRRWYGINLQLTQHLHVVVSTLHRQLRQLEYVLWFQIERYVILLANL